MPLLFVTVNRGLTSVSVLVQFAGVLGRPAVQPPPPTSARLTALEFVLVTVALTV